MERTNWIAKNLESLLSNWASDDIKNQALAMEKVIVEFVNPDTKLIKPPTSEFLMAGFLPAASLTAFYLITIISLSILIKSLFPVKESKTVPKKLSVSEKFRKEPILIIALIYNVIQVVLCSYMVIRALYVAYDNNYTLVCNKFDLADDSMGKVHWVFYMSKVLDLVDTYLIVFRRKWRQLSFLHVYHHTSIFFFSWMNLRTAFDGDMYFTIVLNAGVHVIMYAYYFFKALNFKIPLFIKKTITNLQMIQFVSMLSQASYLYFNNCPYPRRLILIYFCYVASLLALFMNFFIVNYLTKKKVD